MAAAFAIVFLFLFAVLGAFMGFKSFNLIAAAVFSALVGAAASAAVEALMLLPIKALQYNISVAPTVEAACSYEKAVARIARLFAERKTKTYSYNEFSKGADEMLLKLIRMDAKQGTETIFSLEPFFAVKLEPTPSGGCRAWLHYEGDSEGQTMAEIIKTKLNVD